MPIFRKPGFNDSGDDKKRQIPGGLFQKCPQCNAMVHNLELVENQRVCPHCEHHFPQGARERIGQLLDPGSFEERDSHLRTVDMLQFQAASSYSDSLKKYEERTGLHDSVISGLGKLDGRPVALAVLDFTFLGGTLGSVAGEKITRNVETATELRIPAIIISAAGGARLHEGMFALMQMAKTSGALAVHAQARLPFISVLTDPTYGGVIASFASLGDIIVAEPRAMIGFAGPRVIRETTHQDLPPGFQTAEVLEAHGLIDMVVSRRKMRATLSSLLSYLAPAAHAA
jgi:acetyl-CoA carboxylase carboxyl transferase subunit beta